MGPKGIFLSFLIVISIYIWKKYFKKKTGNHSEWVNWILVGLAIYYCLSFIWFFINFEN